MALEIYWGSGSPFAWTALLALEMKKQPYESHLLSFSKEEHKKPEILKMNPRGKVPVLRDGDFCVYESLAILAYLERKFPKPSLFGETPEETAKIMQVISEVNSYMAVHLSTINRPILFGKMEGKADEIRAAAEKVHQEFKFFENGIKEGAWLAGKNVSAADLILFPQLQLFLRALAKDAAKPLNLGFLPFEEKYPRLAKWAKGVEKLPGYDKTYPPHWKG